MRGKKLRGAVALALAATFLTSSDITARAAFNEFEAAVDAVDEFDMGG